MKFFIPHANAENVEETYESIRNFAKKTLNWGCSDRRIFSLDYEHEGKSYHSEVGKVDRRVPEMVFAILESQCYLVCTLKRGVLRGEPILVGRNEVTGITDFEETSLPPSAPSV